MYFKYVFAVLTSAIVFAPAFSQVVNNEITQRVNLILNQPPHTSTTANSSVEPDCINKALTAACLIYHNDQWFTFTAPRDGTYYLNIGDQQCKRKLGLQVLLIEGDPCEIDSYRVKRCISKLTQEDTYVVLDSLRGDVPYLLNIDGFLGDYCEFSIQVADHAAGLPEKDRYYVDSHSDFELTDSVIQITTRLDKVDARKISAIRIYRRYIEDELSLLDSITPARANALGELIAEYLYYDTLGSTGEYSYKVYGVQHDSGELIVLGESQILYVGRGSRDGIFSVELPRGLNRGKPITVRLIYPPNGEVLESYTRSMEYKRDKVHIDFAKYVKAGYTDFVLELSNEGSEKTELIFYRVTTDGRVVRR